MANPGFLNVNLDIRSTANLNLIATELGDRVFVLHSGREGKGRRYLLALENARHYKSPEAAIHAFCKRIERLSPSARRLWTAAQKVFDIGYELHPLARSSRFLLRSSTLEEISDLGAKFAVTYYRPQLINEMPVGVIGEK
jgi:hypothetical protein